VCMRSWYPYCNTHGNCRNFSFYKSELKGLWNLFFQPKKVLEGEEGEQNWWLKKAF
jgi:hypothetical protein